jgi:hypothetical protein
MRTWGRERTPGPQDRARARKALLGLLAAETNDLWPVLITQSVVGLNPTVADLAGSDSWPLAPTPALLAAARRNSALHAWVAALPLLSTGEYAGG